jgi:allophanate hydrolase subunit 2
LAVGGAAPHEACTGAPDLPLPEGDELDVRVMLGPQDDYFSPETISDFLDTPFQISTDADRMGYRLAGHPLKHQGPAEVVSDGIVLGSVQVPPHGNPIIMLADRPSVGGYPKIATVITADIRLLAQCRPGMRLRFRQVTVPEARQALLGQDEHFSAVSAFETSFPVHQVRTLLAAMQRAGVNSASLENAALRLHLKCG